MCRRNDDDKKTYNDEDVNTALLKMAEETKTAYESLLTAVTEQPPPTRYAFLTRSERGLPPRILASRDGKSWESVQNGREYVRVLSVLLEVAYVGGQTDYAVLDPDGQLLRRSTESGSVWEQVVTVEEQEAAFAEIFERLPRRIEGENFAWVRTLLAPKISLNED